MSTQNQAPALPDPDTAYQNLFDGVRAEVFFRKMASYGHVPQSLEQAQYMLDMAGMLREAENAPATKQANAENDPYFLAREHLAQAMGHRGLDSGIKQAAVREQAMAFRNAAVNLAQNPIFYNSVLSLKAAEAANVQAQMQQAG